MLPYGERIRRIKQRYRSLANAQFLIAVAIANLPSPWTYESQRSRRSKQSSKQYSRSVKAKVRARQKEAKRQHKLARKG